MKKFIIIIGVCCAILLIVALLFGFSIFNLGEKQKEAEPATVGEEAPEATFFTVNGEQLTLSEFQGEPVMFWLVATWCPTCSAGVKVLAERISEIEKYNLQIITLKIYNNLGYPGPSIEEFGKDWAGEAFNSSNWFWGDASREASFTYDPKGFPDIYYLIDKEGIIRAKDTAPSATINKIIDFAKSQ